MSPPSAEGNRPVPHTGGHGAPALVPARLYWLLQSGIWGGVAAAHIFMFASVDQLSRAMASGFVAASLLALVGTHIVRAQLYRRRWITLSLPRLGARVVPATLIVAVVSVAGAIFLERVVFPTQSTLPLDPGRLIKIVVYWWALVLSWSGGYLALHFYRQARTAERDRWQLEATVREAELEVLKSQLDPHFMFNSLNSIRALITENPEHARDMVTRLAEILRYSLKANRATTVSLEDEMRIVRSYLELEAVRFEERLRYSVDIDPAVRDVQVPPMMVQLLVENGIKHGVAARVEGGEIRVSAAARDGRLQIVTRSSGRLGSGPNDEGVGLRNARERLRLLYGGRGTLSLREESAGVVVAELGLPIEADREENGARADRR